MYLRFFLVVTILIFYQCNSNEKVLFKVKQLENKTYITSTKIYAESEVDFKGSEEIMTELKSKGMVLPMKIDQEQILVMKVNTYSKNEDGFIPFSGGLDSNSTTQYLNGQVNPQNATNALDSSFSMTGFYKNDKTIIKNISGNNIKPEFSDALKKSIGDMMGTLKFPEYPLGIGDTFSHSVPLSIPVQGVMNVDMVITTHYDLESVKNNIAVFDLEQEFELSSDADETKIEMTGEGSGEMIYDTEIYQMTSMVTESVMKMKVDAGTITVITNADTKTEMKITVTDRE